LTHEKHLGQLAQDKDSSISAFLVTVFRAHPLQGALELQKGCTGIVGALATGTEGNQFMRRLRIAAAIQQA
jgi:hypothetical protein